MDFNNADSSGSTSQTGGRQKRRRSSLAQLTEIFKDWGNKDKDSVKSCNRQTSYGNFRINILIIIVNIILIVLVLKMWQNAYIQEQFQRFHRLFQLRHLPTLGRGTLADLGRSFAGKTSKKPGKTSPETDFMSKIRKRRETSADITVYRKGSGTVTNLKSDISK